MDCYNGYFLANRDAPSRCIATDCLVSFVRKRAKKVLMLIYKIALRWYFLIDINIICMFRIHVDQQDGRERNMIFL